MSFLAALLLIEALCITWLIFLIFILKAVRLNLVVIIIKSLLNVKKRLKRFQYLVINLKPCRITYTLTLFFDLFYS